MVREMVTDWLYLQEVEGGGGGGGGGGGREGGRGGGGLKFIGIVIEIEEEISTTYFNHLKQLC